jgi:hypothetical protein
MASWINKLFYRQKPKRDRKYPGWDSVATIAILVSVNSKDIPVWLNEVIEAWRKAGKEVYIFNWIGKRKPLPGGDANEFGSVNIRFNKHRNLRTRKLWANECDLFLDLSDVDNRILHRLIAKADRSFSAGINPRHRLFYELYVPLKNTPLKEGFTLLEGYLNLINKTQKTV